MKVPDWLAKAWELLAWARWMACQAGATEEALERSIEYARRAGDSRTEAAYDGNAFGDFIEKPEADAKHMQQPRFHEPGIGA